MVTEKEPFSLNIKQNEIRKGNINKHVTKEFLGTLVTITSHIPKLREKNPINHVFRTK